MEKPKDFTCYIITRKAQQFKALRVFFRVNGVTYILKYVNPETTKTNARLG